MHPLRPLRRPILALALAGLVPLSPATLAQTSGAETTQSQLQGTAAPAMLIADRVYLDGPGKLVAEGNVEALRDDLRIRARRISYDQATGALSIEGPITLTGTGEQAEAIVLADSAQLDGDFRNGILTSARMMLGTQVQLAARQMARVDDRYNQLYKTTVSSCKVCNDGKPPLWQIRAQRVVHDEDTRQLYFDHATFEIYGLPVFYLPYLRLPDPTQERVTGFLFPTIKRNSQLGTGLKMPYFITLGETRDLLLTPYISGVTKTLEYRYRQAFGNGALSFSGAFSKDTLDDRDLRGYVQTAGTFFLDRDLVLRFNIAAISDDAYLSDYGYSDTDRLKSEIALSRAKRDEWMRGALVHYHTLRETEENATIPSIIGEVEYERRFFPETMGGEFRLGLQAHSHFRYSDDNTDGSDPDDITDGRDVSRLNVMADWRRSYTLLAGLRAEAMAGLAIDSFHTVQDSVLPERQTGVVPMTAVTLRWPLQRVDGRGAVTIIEPVAQLAWSGGTALNVANDESTRTEFDEGNLLGLTRFASPDRREHGWRAAYGATISQYDPSGWSSRLVLGQIVQDDPDPSFNQSSGLTGTYSNLLVAGQIQAPNGWSLSGRGLFDNGLSVTKTSARAGWVNERAAFGATYVWLGPDEAVDRASVISEWTVDGSYRFNENWEVDGNIRYDVASDSPATAGLGVTWSNECVDVTIAASKNFTSSSVVTPSTDISFTIGLRGFSAQTSSASYAGGCRN